MSSSVIECQYTAQEYLALERAAETKSEYYQGEIIPMTGASRRHNLLVTSLIVALYNQIGECHCEVYPSDMRVAIPAETYTYPDVVVACDPPQFEDAQVDTLVNPTVLVEVLSQSTENYDRGRKFQGYRTINSLTDYILISQDRCRVEQFTRQPDDFWLYKAYEEMTDTLQIQSIDCAIQLQNIYEKLSFD